MTVRSAVGRAIAEIDLGAVRDEIAQMEEEIAFLRDVETLVQRLKAPEPRPAKEPPKPVRRQTAGSDGLTATDTRVLEAIRNLGECTPKQVGAALGLDVVNGLGKHTRKLLNLELIEASGSTKDRRLRPAGQQKRTLAFPQPEGLGVECLRLIEARQGDRDDHALAKKLGATVEEVVAVTAELAQDGRIWASPAGCWALGEGPAA